MPIRRFSIRDQVWEVYAQKIIQNPGITKQILSLWNAEMEGSAKLLESITAKLPPNKWMQMKPMKREEIMRELIRIDGGRGEIVNWLNSIIRQEDRSVVLQEAGKWKPQGYAYPGVLLETWKHKIDSHREQGIAKNVETALEVIVSAALPASELPEHPRWKSWDERQRAATILKYLSEGKRTAGELEILSRWEPPPGFDGADILLAMVRQWGKWMSNVAIAQDKKLVKGGMQNRKYRVAVWKGLSGAARNCPGNEGWEIALSWLRRLKHWLVNDWDGEMLEVMGRCRPPEGKLQEEWVEIWSDCLVSFPGWLKWPVWQVVGGYLAANRKAGPHVQRIAANYLKALYELAGKVSKLDDPEKMLSAILPFRGLTPRQQKEWNMLWTGMLNSGDSSILGAVTRHLLSLAASGQSDRRQITEALLKKLVTKIPAKAVEDMLKEIREWEGDRVASGGLFHEALQRLQQCRQWHHPEIRWSVINQLLHRLESVWQNGERLPELERLWLETLCDEKDQLVIERMSGWQIRNMTGMPPDVLREMREIWKKRTEVACPKMRKCAWMILKEIGEDEQIAALLERFWEQEENLEVVEVVASWTPPLGKQLPPGFHEGWEKCFQRLLEKTIQNGRNDKEVTQIIWTVELLSENLMGKWLQENRLGEKENDELGKIQLIWEAVVKNLPEELQADDRSIRRRMETKLKQMEILLSLDDPPEIFQSRLEKEDGEYFIQMTYPLILAHKMSELRKAEDITSNTKHNLGLIMVFGLKDCIDYNRERAGEVLQRLWGDLAWTPDRMPGGWKEFCDFFMNDQKLNKIMFFEAIQLGCAVNDFRCRLDFRQRLENIWCSGDTLISNLAEAVLWHDVIIKVEIVTAVQLINKRGTLDTTGALRWLRQFILNFENLPDRWEDEKDTKGKKEMFVNVLWTNVFPHLTGDESPGKMEPEKIKEPGLAVRGFNFHHPHGTVVHETESLNSIDPRNGKPMPVKQTGDKVLLGIDSLTRM